jgi:hypothetical protein
VTRWTYGGAANNDVGGGGGGGGGGSIGLKGKQESTVCSFDGALSDETLLKHPDLQTFITKYGMTISQTGDFSFPQWMPSTSASANGGAHNSGKLPNPLYGSKTFLDFKLGTWTHSYASRGMPSNIYSAVGKIIRSVPPFSTTFPDRDWLVGLPTFSIRGQGTKLEDTIYQIDDHYLLSVRGGWPKEIYKDLTR